MGITQLSLRCDEHLPNAVNAALGRDAQDVSLLIVEPVCENCSLNIELYCKNTVTDPTKLSGAKIIYSATYGWITRPFLEDLGAEPVLVNFPDWANAFEKADTSCIAHLNIGDPAVAEMEIAQTDDGEGSHRGEPIIFSIHSDISPSETYALLETTHDFVAWRRVGVDATCSRNVFLLAEKSVKRRSRTLTGQHPFVAAYEDTISSGDRHRDAEFHCREIKFKGDKIYSLACSKLNASRSEFIAYVNAAREPDSFTSDNNGGLASWECPVGASEGTCEMSLSYSHVQRQLDLSVSRDLAFLNAANAVEDERAQQACGSTYPPRRMSAPSARAEPPVATAQQQPADAPTVEEQPRQEPVRMAANDKERELEQICIRNNNSWFQRDCACAVEQFRTASADVQQRSVRNFLSELKGCMDEAAVRDELTKLCGQMNNTRARANQIGGGQGPQTPLTDCGCYSAELGDWIIANNVSHRRAFTRKSVEISGQCQ